jgi:pimeloyl-ACP methyl ester carboxylesterase
LLHEIGCPTLVLVGAQDALTSPEHADEIAEDIDGAARVVVPECGELCAMERPAAVAQALAESLT